MRLFASLSVITMIAIGIVFALYAYSRRDEDRSNGFVRKMPPHITGEMKEYDLGVNSFYIAGFSKDFVYLGNTTVFNRVFAIDKKFTDTTQYYIDIKKADTIWGGVNIYVDSPAVLLTQSVHPSIRISSLSNPTVLTKALRTSDLLDLYAISESTVVGRYYDRRSSTSFFFKENVDDSFSFTKKILERSEEGVFTGDGMMTWDPHRRYFCYVFFYKNRFMKLDANLNVLLEGKTIDTFSLAQLSLGYTNSRARLSFASTPRTVNKFSFIADDLLFIQSAVKASNETVHGFNASLAMDVYSTISGKYLFSFYLPFIKGHKFTSIQAHEGFIYAIYDQYLVSFKLYLNNFRGNYR